jgi:DNA-binding SARP family transcriptional activator/tetratricopeptide (TPR) repeat protein
LEKISTHVNELQIRLLGPTLIGDGANRVALRSLPERVLWVLAAAMPDRISSDELATAVWEEDLPPTWQSALRTHVATVRRVLGSCPHAPQLVHDRSGYVLAGNMNDIDIHRFRDLVQRSRSAESAEQQKALLDLANELWGSPPFQRTMNADLHAMADRLVGLREEAERQRHLLAVELGGAESVVEQLGPAAHEDPSNLSVIEPYAAALIALERIDEARKALSKHRFSIESFGLEPGPGVTALERRLLSIQLKGAKGNIRSLAYRLPPMLKNSGRFVGREKLLAQFSEDLAAGDMSYVVFQGPPGYGKTQIGIEIARIASEMNIPVLAAWAEEHGSPFQLLGDLLQPWKGLIDGISVEVVENLLGSISDASSSHRLVVVLEDIQFADLATAKLLRRLVRREPIDGVLFVLTVRDAFRNAAVEQLLLDLHKVDSSRIVAVEALSLEETVDLVRVDRRMSQSAAWTEATRLYRLSEGVPLVLDLLLRNEMQDSRLMPISAMEAVVSSASRLEEDLLKIVITGALLGLDVELPIVADACGVSFARVCDAFDAAHNAGLSDRRVGKRTRFRHSLIRQALFETRSLVWRCEMHRALAEALERRAGDVFAVLQQRAWALPNETTTKEFERLLTGARQLQTANRWEESLAIIDVMEIVANTSPSWMNDEQLFEFLLLKAQACDGCADAGLARLSFRRAFRLAQTVGNPAWVFQTAIAAGGSSQPIDGDTERSEWLREAFAPSSGLDERLRIEALAEFIYVRALASVDDDVELALAELHRLVASVDDDRSRAFDAHATLVTQLSLPNASERLELAKSASPFGYAGPPEVATTPLLAQMQACLQLGLRSEAEAGLIAIEELANRRQRPGDRWVLLLIRSVLEEWDGNLESAMRYAEMARSLSLRHEIYGGREAWALFLIARAWRVGDIEGLTRFAQVDSTSSSALAMTAMIYAQLGDLRKASSIARDAYALLANEPRYLGWVGATLALGEAVARAAPSMVPAVQELLIGHSGLIVVNGLVPTSCFGPVDRVLALLAKSNGDEKGSAHFRKRCVEQLSKARLRWE